MNPLIATTNIATTNYRKPAPKQHGFTLAELMLSLSLGLVVSAAAFKLFSHSIDIQRIQLSTLEVQETAIYNLASLNKDIALANQGSSRAMTQQSAWTGIVLTGSMNSGEVNEAGQFLKVGNLRGVSGIDAQLLTRNQAGPSNVLTPMASDQLTIQYQAADDGFDCEGRTVKQGERVIQRLFTRTDRQKADNETKSLAIVLACDAGRYVLPDEVDADNVTTEHVQISNFGDNGVILINRVDYFEVMLGVRSDHGMAYLPIDRYLASKYSQNSSSSVSPDSSGSDSDWPIVAIQLGIIGRGHHSIKSEQDHPLVFKVNGTDRIIKQQHPSYVRRTLQSVVYLRHGAPVF